MQSLNRYLADAYALLVMGELQNDDNPVYVVDYNPEWPRKFEQLSWAIQNKLGSLALRVEHIGSTSVPGLAAKPIIDLEVVIEAPEQLSAVSHHLQELGYRYEGDRGIPGREAFAQVDETVPHCGHRSHWLKHHLYVCAQNSAELKRHLVFRDYLRTHPDVRQEYGDLKKDLARRFRCDRVAYTDAKHEFITRVLAEAQL